MTVRDFITTSDAKVPYQIAFYEYEEYSDPICYTRSNWQGIEPYMDREIGYFRFANQREDYFSGDIIYQVDIHFTEKGE